MSSTMSTQQRLRVEAANLDSQKTDVVLLIDSSSSISNSDYSIMKDACKSIVEFFSEDTAFGIVQFASQAQHVLSIVSDKNKVITTLRDLKRIKGSTNTVEGLQMAEKVFDSSMREGSKRVLFLLTDGRPDSDPSKAALNIKFKGVIIVAIGIGSKVSKKGLKSAASFGYTYMLASFNMLRDTFSKPKTSEIRDFEVVVKALFPHGYLSIGEDVSLILEIENIGLKPLPKNCIVLFHENSYFDKHRQKIPKDIPDGEKIKLKVCLPCKARVSVSDLCPYVQFSIKDKNGSPIYCNNDRICFSVDNFIGDSVSWRPICKDVKEVNILLFGVWGSGKSSFVCTVVSALKNQVHVETNVAVVGGTSGHVTKALRRFNLAHFTSIDDLKINLWDTWGVSSEDYTKDYTPEKFEELLSGVLPDGYEMYDRRRGAELRKFEITRKEREMHAILFFIPHTILQDNGTILKKLQTFCKISTEQHMNPIIVVTMTDTLLEKDREPARQKIAQIANIPLNRVFLLFNYTAESKKDFEIDLKAYTILTEALKNANQYLKRRMQYEGKSLTPSQKITQKIESFDEFITPQSKKLNETFEEISASVGSPKRRMISIRLWGQTKGKGIRLPDTMDELISIAEKKLKCKAEEICNEEGDSIDDIEDILESDRSVFYVVPKK